MLGCHPALCALPETCLLTRELMSDYVRDLNFGTYDGGLVHAVQELIFADQADGIRERAAEWLAARRNDTTLSIFDELRRRASPRIIIEKSPSMTSGLTRLRRIEHLFSGRARFIHLTRHPLSYGTSLLETLRKLDAVKPSVARRRLQQPDSLFFGAIDPESGAFDPQRSWLKRHGLIDSFLSEIDEDRSIRVRGEDFLNAPRKTLERVTNWLQLSSDVESIDDMLHPEKWKFARPRAIGHRRAGDRKFYTSKKLRSKDTSSDSLDCALGWRGDGRGFDEPVKRLAASYGYR